MTVKELREILEELDEDMEVMLASDGTAVRDVTLGATALDGEIIWEVTLY